MKLKIVCKLSLDNSPSSQLAGISSALASVNDGILIWNEKEKPTWDMFYEHSPDIVVCLDKDYTPSIMNARNEYKNTKLVVIGSNFKPEWPVDLLCATDIEESNYTLPLIPYANLVDFNHSVGQEKAKYASEVMCLEENVSEIMNCMHQFNFKAFSLNGRVHHQNYIGKIFARNIPDAMRSTKVFADLSGNSDMICNAMVMKTPCLSAVNCFLDRDYMPVPSSMDDFMNYMRTLLYKENFAKEHVEKCYEYVVSNHTYFHCVSKLYEKLGYKEFSSDSIKAIGRYV
jgi:hypothetical protein|tara:strand:+ start:276 stop:1133 length:858 start_codon:yes stop_codon:yes gene_type:complete